MDGPDSDRGTFRTYRVYRQLALAPAVYWTDPADPVYAYIKNQRGMVEHNLDETIGGTLQVYHNGAFFLPEEGVPCGDCFPRDQMLSDIILLLFERLSEKTACGIFDRTADDRIHLTYQAFFDELDALRREHQAQWGKTAAEKELSALAQDVLEELSYWGFAFVDQDIITFNPGFSLWQGIYPKKQ